MIAGEQVFLEVLEPLDSLDNTYLLEPPPDLSVSGDRLIFTKLGAAADAALPAPPSRKDRVDRGRTNAVWCRQWPQSGMRPCQCQNTMSDPDNSSEKRRKLDVAPNSSVCGGRTNEADDHPISMTDLRALLDERDRKTRELVDRRDEEIRAMIEERDRQHEAKSAELQEQIDSLLGFVQELMKNQDWYRNKNWAYPISCSDISESKWLALGFDPDVASFASGSAQMMTATTRSLRVGGSCVEIGPRDSTVGEIPHHEMLLPHWRELCSAICLSDVISEFKVSSLHMDSAVMQMIERALRNKNSLQMFALESNGFDDDDNAVIFATNIINSNHKMKNFIWHDNVIDDSDAASGLIDALVCHPTVEKLQLSNALLEDDSHDLVKYLFVSGRELYSIDIEGNDIRTNGDSTISDFLATNPCLQKLKLGHNCLNDDDVMLVANALRTNHNLKLLDIEGNGGITIAGHEALSMVLFDHPIYDVGRTILNSVSDSNHTCRIKGLDSSSSCHYELNRQGGDQANRRAKLYTVFYYGNDVGTNAQMTRTQLPQDERAIKLIPSILSSIGELPAGLEETHFKRSPLSILFEIVSSWNVPEMFAYVFRGVQVEGCGVNEVNGFFRYAGYHDDCPMYCRSACFKGATRVFTLFRCTLADDSRLVTSLLTIFLSSGLTISCLDGGIFRSAR